MSARILNKEDLLLESSYAKYSKRMHRQLPKGVLSLSQAKCSNDIKILFSRHYGIVFFTDDYTFALHSLSDFGRQSTILPYKMESASPSIKGKSTQYMIDTHEAFLKEFFSELRLIENLDELIEVINNLP